MKILYDGLSIDNLPHVRLGIDIDGRKITLVATEEDRETKEITVIGCAHFDAKNVI